MTPEILLIDECGQATLAYAITKDMLEAYDAGVMEIINMRNGMTYYGEGEWEKIPLNSMSPPPPAPKEAG